MPARKKFVLTQALLNRAWKWKAQGLKEPEIKKKLKITDGQWNKHRHTIVNHFKKQAASAAREDSQRSKPKLANVDLDKLRAYVIAGLKFTEIAKQFNMSASLFSSYRKDFPIIQEIIDTARNDVAAGVANDMVLGARDREVIREAVAFFKGKAIKKAYKDVIPGNFQAQKHILNNFLPEAWSNDPQPRTSNNKGAILEHLDRVMNDDKD